MAAVHFQPPMKIDNLPLHALKAHSFFDFNQSDTSCFSDTTAEPPFIVGFVTLKRRMAYGNFSLDLRSGVSKSSSVLSHAEAEGLDSAAAAAVTTSSLYLEFDCQLLLCLLMSGHSPLVSSTSRSN